MTSRERKNSTSNIAPQDVIESNIIESSATEPAVSRRGKKRRSSKPRDLRRRQLIESLEQRQLLAGPQLIGIQPNEGELIVDGTVRNTAPRSLTFRFDQDQQIDPATLGAIQITRDGPDDQFGTADDVRIQPGSVSLGALEDNEVVVRFADALPDDTYRIDVFGYDAPTSGIVGLRNEQGELLVARDGVGDAEHIRFDLKLGARVESVVPQPVVRLADGSLQQRRDEILVYFNDDELFVENDPTTGLPTDRSAENPRFYQLLLTHETVRTTDDAIYYPDRVIYDAATNTSRLIFADDLNQLPDVSLAGDDPNLPREQRIQNGTLLAGVPLSGGTFRLRIGTAVDRVEDLVVKPTELDVVPRVSSNLGIASDLEVRWVSKVFGESIGNRLIRFINSGAGGLSVQIDPASDDIVYDFGGSAVTVAQLRNITQNTPSVDAVVSVSFSRGGVAGAGGGLPVSSSLTQAAPLQLAAVGDTLTTATDIGVFGQTGSQLLSSILISESIDPLPYGIQLPGAATDPGRADLNGALAQAINDRFGPDVTDGVTEIEYNFQGIFAGGVGTGLPAQLNNITAIQKRRVREAISLWSQYLGVQFRETKDSGVTFALGTPSELTAATGTEIRSIAVLDADLRIDPTFAESAMVFSNQASFRLNYGEDFFRKAMAGIGILLGLDQNNDVTVQTLMALDPEFLNQTINPVSFISPIDPTIPVQASRRQTINPQIDAQTIDDPLPNALEGYEPVFPGRQDILHGQLLHRPDSVDVDLYRFEVALDAGREFGTLTVESFAERLPDSSLLDTSLTLFEDVSASATTNFGLGSALSVRVDSQLPGDLGNRSRIEFVQTDRTVGDTAVRVGRIVSSNGELVENAIRIDMPRRGANVAQVRVSQIINAINNDAFASTLFRVSLVEGDLNANVIDSSLGSFSPIRLSGGGTVALTRNDDYFSKDSLLTAQLKNGVYYIGVAASGNEQYNPTVANSGFGGRTQGDYELLVKFEPQVSRTDVLRDLDSDRVGVPGTALDGDLDGKPGGVNNFWFQTRPLDRILNVVSGGSGIIAGQTMTITGADNTVRTFEFVPVGQSVRPGNVAVRFSPLNAIADIAVNLASAISANGGALGVTATPLVDLGNPLAPAQVVLTGERSVKFSANFQGVEALGRTLFVDKVASVVADGSLDQPFNNIAGAAGLGAFAATLPGDIVRIVGNGGQDANITTVGDNFAYQVGLTEINGGVLPDGRHLDVPNGVTMMIDAGTAFKLRGATISVGSNNLLTDRNGGVVQVLGTPTLLQISDPSPIGAAVEDPGLVDLGASGNVVFTSTRDRSVDSAASGNSPAAAEGNWGGIIFRSDFDRSEGRPNLEDEGIFLQVVNHADIRYGGGSNILINSVQQTVNPIQIVDLRPTITHNRLTRNASAAMSASPDAFLETRFQEPKFQQAGAFTADYSRIGPDIKQNLVIDNSINGLFIRTITQIGQPARSITVAAHIDDVDIVHYIAENVVIAGQPGGPIQDEVKPDTSSVSLNAVGGGALPVGTIDYRITFVDRSGFESLPSDPSISVTTTSTARQVQVLNLPLIPNGSDYLTRRLYRMDPVDGVYRLVTELNRSASSFIDNGSVVGGAELDLTRAGIRGRLNGSLVVDPNTVIKFRGARIELDHGTQLLAEGVSGQRVVFTSALDDRFGAGGSFDTNQDANTPGGSAPAARGDWGGIYAGPTSNVSLDNAVVAYGGGVSLIEGGQSRGFGALELQQATARVTNTRFEYNDNAQDGSGPVGRNGRLAVTPATIYARYTQPIIAGNDFVDNYGAIIDIDLASLTDELIIDAGRQTGNIDLLTGYSDNHGPLIRNNTSDGEPGDVDGNRQMNGLRIRAGEVTGGTVFDDTDVTHVLYESVIVGNLVSSTTGLTLKSRPDESLVVKFSGGGTPNSATAGTGITATGSQADIADRIGGTVHIVGLPGAPVVLTSLKDDSVGAGRRSDGTAQTDTNGDGFGSRPESNDWRSVFFDGLSNDRNVAVILEEELTTTAPPGRNADVQNAQILGDLADRLTAGDDRLRLGFDVEGFISAPGDVDTYAFTASGGTQVWIDVDNTSRGLDTMIEVVDDFGNVIARSDDSFNEVEDPSQIDILAPNTLAGGLGNADNPRIPRWENGAYYDVGSTNLSDAGFRVTLPGVVGTRSDFYIRIRGASVDPDDIAGGSSSGVYKFQLRLREEQEFPGSVVRHADIRYANHGIHVQGLPGSSPLLGEAQENEAADPYSEAARSDIDLNVAGLPIAGGYGIDGEPRYGTDLYANNDRIDGGFYGALDPLNPTVLNSRPQNLGDLINSKTGTISVGGQLSDVADIDFYQLDIDRDGSLTDLRRSTIFDIDYAAGFDRPDTNISVFYSPTGNPNQASLVLFGEDSNVLDDLSSPLNTELIGELLDRGSISESDPLIGPVALPSGSYFIAVTESGRVPTELTANTRVRRTPVDSGVRIFDDHIDAIGGSTAEAPVNGEFINVSTGGWSVTTNRDIDLGHDRPTTVTALTVDDTESAIATVPAVPTAGFNVTHSSDFVQSSSDDGDEPGDPVFGEPDYDFTPDTIILEFQSTVPAARRNQLLAQEGLQLSKEFHSIDAIVVKTQPGKDIAAEVRRLSEMSEIKYAEPDYRYSPNLVPNDPFYSTMWGLDNTGQTGGTPDADIDAPEAWDISTGDPQTVIAVIDSGIDLTHPDLVANLWVNPGEIPGDGIDNDGNGYIDDINGIDPFLGTQSVQDTFGHGTHVSGTIAAVGDNGVGVTGVTWDSKIMTLRVGDNVVGYPVTAIIEAIDYVTMMKRDYGINIVVSNNSYGGFFPSFAMRAAILVNTNEGIPFVASAGNSSLDNDQFPAFPASFDLPGIISVAATDHNDDLATFSNFGLGSVDLAAPGVNILSTIPGGGYGLNSGTSMASPHVAGVVAMMAAYQPSATVADLKTAVMQGADRKPNLTATSVTGARLNAFGALAALPSGTVGNESIYYDRSEAVGQLTSNAFDLTGYSAADLPRFYFDYFVDAAANDDIVVQAFSNEQPTPVQLGIDLDDPALGGQWRQAILPLGQFAGDTGIVIEFIYNTDLTDTAEGLYLDNFIVGFAERGEMVSGAQFGEADFTTTFTGTPGEYQLEIRPATDYTQTIQGGILVERALEAAPKVIDSLYLKVSSGREIAPYETFTIDVLNTVTGLDEPVVFQFQPVEPARQDATMVDPTAVPVPFARNDLQSGIVNRVITSINGLTDYAFFRVRPTAVELTHSFDTNDRHGHQLTLIAPSGDQISENSLSEGSTFRLGDGSHSSTFEFSSDAIVKFGNIRVPYSPTDTAAQVARSIIQVINSGVVQGNLQLRASTVTGDWDFSNPTAPDPAPTDGRVALHGTAFGNFHAVNNIGEAPQPGTSLPVAPDGSLILSAIFHEGVGDRNTQRTQGQVIVENNQITDVHAVGIWSDPGRRGTDPEDNRSPDFIPAPTGNNFIQMPPVGNTLLGGVINFPELNDSVEGGLAPGLVAQNNIIDQAGYTGIKVDGEPRPLVIEWNNIIWTYLSGGTEMANRGDIMVPDGFTMAIDAGGTRVVFEFEDIGGTPTNFGGSGVTGGDGFVDGHVPIYYRLGGGNTYNPNLPDPVRNIGYTSHEMMMAIYESIQGSILVTNDLVELVRPTLGPSLTSYDAPLVQAEDLLTLARPQILDPNYLDFFTPAIYLEGATAIYTSSAFVKQDRPQMLNIARDGFAYPLEIDTIFNFQTGETSNTAAAMMPIAEAPQPLAKLINNTVRGSDGTEGAFLEDGTLSPAVGAATDEPNDVIANAVDTKLEVSHRGGYFADGVIGDNLNFLTAEEDVDFFKVELAVGDRLIADIDTTATGPETLLRVFDSTGTEVAVGQVGALPEYLNPGSSLEFPVLDNANTRDGFVDFTALKKDTYYVGVSSAGNAVYQAKSLTDRTPGTGGTGDYSLAIDVLAPRSFVFSLDNHPLDAFGAEQLSGNINGTQAEGGPNNARTLVGTTFTISQIPDYLIPTRQGDAYANVVPDGNRVTFEFTGGANTIVLPNGNINVPILNTNFMTGGGYRVPDIMRAIAQAINGYLNNPAVPNNEVGNGPDGRDGPITRVEAKALGGTYGDNIGIENMIRTSGCDVFLDISACPYGIFGTLDFTTGFGHDRRESGSNNVVPNGTFNDSRGTTELYVLINNAAKIELSPEARAAGLKLGPDNSKLANGDLRNPGHSTESDQLLAEQGIHIGSGASAAVLNNVVVNVHQSLVKEESSVFGFGGRIDALNPDVSIKQGSVVAAGNAFQYDDYRNSQMRSDISWWVAVGGFVNRNPNLDMSLSTDLRTGPSNVAGGDSDFNFVVQQPGTPGQTPGNFITFIGDDVLEDGAAGRFTPALNSPIIDSAVDSLNPNVDLVTLNSLLGIPTRSIDAPKRDQSGQLRADEPTQSPPGGIGADVFKDRGALDRADFVGPSATLDSPQDDDFAGLDTDPAYSYVNRKSGVFTEFRVLVQDLGDDSNPFVGTGIDNSTVVVSPIPGLRKPGANVTLFENERLLVEGIDYTFSYDASSGLITLKPLAGVWRNDRSYRIELNNRDRTVLIAPDASQVSDGDQLSVVDSNGGTVIFEFESGYLMQMPEALTLEVPREGTNQGGLIDGGVFSIGDGVNPDVIFEFDSNGTTVPGSVPVTLPSTATPVDEAQRQQFLEVIAENLRQAIQGVINDPNRILDINVRTDGTKVIISSEPGTRVDVSTSGLIAASRTLGLQVPLAGADVGGVIVGEQFVVNDGNASQTFTFIDANNPAPGGTIGVDISPINGAIPLTSAEVASVILASINASSLNLTPEIIGRTVYLDLPVQGSAAVPSGRLRVVGISRTPGDGDLIVVTPKDGSAPVVFEINRTDERIGAVIIDDGVTSPNIPINITRDATGDELAAIVAQAIGQELQVRPIDGLPIDDVRAVGQGILRVGGEEGLGLSVTGMSLEVSGTPSVTGASTLEVFGPLLMEVPFTAPADGDTFTIVDNNGIVIPFEFDSNSILNNLDPNTQRIVFTRFDDQVAVATAITNAINNAAIGITATYQGGGDISLGLIQQNRVDTTTTSLSTRRGIVSDGEVISITQGALTVRYEFESIVNGGGVRSGNIPVPFQPGSTTLDVANSLAAAITSNSGGLTFNPDPEVNAQGLVALNDVPGTLIDVSTAPSIILGGVPGGAVAVNFSPADSKFDVNQALLDAINSIGAGSTLFATDRGGATLFVENGRLFEGPVPSYFLPAIKDLVGNPLNPNREDNTTQFTLLLPTVALDYGDAPDPRDLLQGHYPSLLANDGARHVVTPELTLGTRVDSEPDAQVTGNADGDDLIVSISTSPATGSLFGTLKGAGFAEIQVLSGVDPLTRDGDTVTLTLSDRTVTIEFDTNGIFQEQNFAIAPSDPTSTLSIALAVRDAIEQTGLDAGEIEVIGDRVRVFSDDEDGVSFVSQFNPNGNLNKNIPTPISVTVNGTGLLQGWIDFNADGDWDDPGEQIIGAGTPGAVFRDTGSPVTRVFNVTVPAFASPPPNSVATYARFRVSREGGLEPVGLALSGEVEDYNVLLVPGAPPTIGASQSTLTYSAQEDGSLLVLDEDGTSTTSPADDGLLRGIVDPDGDAVAIYRGDVGIRTLFTATGEEAGELDLASNGTFTFIPVADFNGQVIFNALVTDVKPGAPGSELVNPQPLTVTINVAPVNDKPFATVTDVVTNVTIDEDTVTIFTAEDLIDPFYAAGPPNESDQTLIFQSVSSATFGDAVSSLGGILEILPDGRSVRYTPPQDYNGTQPDTFNFVVADVLQGSVITLAADKPGTVSITINAVNDPPIARPDFYNANEDTNLSIPIRGGGSLVGILDNDQAGPQNEIDPPESQTISLPTNQFPITTQRGGIVRFQNGQLVYSPPGLYSGPDGFTYRIVDLINGVEGAEAFGSVSITVGGENNQPRFEGVNGEKDNLGNPVKVINAAESKPNDTSEVYMLDTWFSDPENDNLSYTVSSNNASVVSAMVDGSTLTLTRTAYAFGNVILTINASDLDEFGAVKTTVTQTVTVSIANENDPPELLDDLGTVTAMEGDDVALQLTRPTRDGVGAFFDPDGETLTYRIVRIGETRYNTDPPANPHPLIDAISTAGGQLSIDLDDDASGTVEIEIEASDSQSLIRDVLTLVVTPVPDAPVAQDDAYNVAIGATLRVLNPANGLLRNDFDADNDPISVDLDTVTQPSRGTLEINADGTFIYTSNGGMEGDIDTFTYRVKDQPISGSPRFSQFRTVTLTLSRSQYQNPIVGRAADVNADGFISPIDALRIINFLARRAPVTGAVAVSEIGTAPPDFYDTDGNGMVSPNDALVVINALALNQTNGEGESVAADVAAAGTTAFAAPSMGFLPSSVRVASPIAQETEPAMTVTESTDALLTAGLQIESVAVESAGDTLVEKSSRTSSETSVDDVLADWFDTLESSLEP